MNQDILQVLISEEEIKAKVAELGKTIAEDYRGKDPLVICVLKGALCFMSDLIRATQIPLSIDFLAVSSYGASTQSSGVLRILKDLDSSLEGRHVLIVEDIIDTGLTLNYLVENLWSRQPASLRICTLLDKPSRRKVELKPDYSGFVIPDKFVVGYGLDYAERYRNLPHVAVLKPEVYIGS